MSFAKEPLGVCSTTLAAPSRWLKEINRPFHSFAGMASPLAALLPPGSLVCLPDGTLVTLQRPPGLAPGAGLPPSLGLAPPGAGGVPVTQLVAVPLPVAARPPQQRPPRGGAQARAQARWVAPFVRQLHELADRPETLVSWEPCGSVLRVADPRAFAAEVCPIYFRHRNWTSFTRMMNLYSFRMLNGTSRAVAPDACRTARFVHPHFQRDAPSELWRVVREKRKAPEKVIPVQTDASAGAQALLGLAAAASTLRAPPPAGPTAAASSLREPPPSGPVASTPPEPHQSATAPMPPEPPQSGLATAAPTPQEPTPPQSSAAFKKRQVADEAEAASPKRPRNDLSPTCATTII